MLTSAAHMNTFTQLDVQPPLPHTNGAYLVFRHGTTDFLGTVRPARDADESQGSTHKWVFCASVSPGGATSLSVEQLREIATLVETVAAMNLQQSSQQPSTGPQ
jgi:hypothetical protein